MEVDNSSSSNSRLDSGLGSSRQRFNIELRPGETTIVSWKRLIKEANKLDPSLTATAQEAHKVQVALDEYFQDEETASRYTDCNVDRGKLEHLNEPIASTDCQLKKRKKDMPKALGERVDDHLPNKNPKLGHAKPKVAAKNVPSEKQTSCQSQSLAANSEHYHDGKSQHPSNSPIGVSRKKLADTSIKSEYSFSSGISNKDASVVSVNSKDTEKQRIGTADCRNLANKVKDESRCSGSVDPKYDERNASKQIKPQFDRLLTDFSESKFSTNVWQREGNGSNGLPDLNIPASPIELVSQKTAFASKDASSLRPKGSTLERAIRELEKVVAESRPPHMEVQEADTSSIAVKRRLPREVKQKLAKVARLAQSSQGRISDELVNRLMSILGHLVQLRTLKRNLREMVSLGLSAKREKADRFQQIKMEVIEMIKLQVSKQSDEADHDFQETFGSEEKRVLKGKFSMNNALEDKICDLYDLYIQEMDEDKGPQIRKLYTELAELWPNGAMDNHGIKKAIYRAKDRRKTLCDNGKVQEKGRSKKLSMPTAEGIVKGEIRSLAQLGALHEKMIIKTNTHILASPNKMISSAVAFDHHLVASMRTSSSMSKGMNMDFPKQERLERLAYPMSKDKLKQQKVEMESNVDKLTLKPNKESHKSHKRVVGYPDHLSDQLAAPSNSGRPR